MQIHCALFVLGLDALVAAGFDEKLGSVVNRPVLGGGAVGFGGGFMEHTFQSYATLPMNVTELEAQGWKKNEAVAGGCNPDLGWTWIQDGHTVVDTKKPIVLYTTEGGQISGVGVLVTGDLPVPQRKWAQRRTNGWQIDVAFRQGEILCSGEVSEATIGDILIANPSGPKMQIPLFEKAADSAGWHRGSCFDGMGWHRYLDTEFHNTSMSWKAENLFPVAAMFSGGDITAINFATWQVQQGMTGAHQWDPLPTPSFAMCAGMCDPACKTFLERASGRRCTSTSGTIAQSNVRQTLPASLGNLALEVGCSAAPPTTNP
eukprot:CAMPEP_0180598426 /NCGR_PEP_ID=MMETSP1037_2-20121125/22862_1 /TAXON_ID=632150 /ORGANISM="Azadinium spinosum, Strain 3D9" /LENGTH=316 /DNA_ID=CAMNT_0022617041 /DNA_START=162 /DNA_END=1113 /DNA_ORIENTATION=+